MTIPPLELHQIADDGFTLLPGVFSASEVPAIRDGLESALRSSATDGAIRDGDGGVYAARNILTLWPPAASIWQRPPLLQRLAALLGDQFGLVRALFFDKPPDRTWALPWHKDLTIAVQDNRIPSPRFARPTTKAGVPHIEAPSAVLERMVTARIHLDDATEENGPLRLAPGSHRTGKTLRLEERPPHTVLARAGDVLLMRPLVAHCSNRSHPETRQHRRILHLEFAATPELPDGYAWHTFVAAQ